MWLSTSDITSSFFILESIDLAHLQCQGLQRISKWLMSHLPRYHYPGTRPLTLAAQYPTLSCTHLTGIHSLLLGSVSLSKTCSLFQCIMWRCRRWTDWVLGQLPPSAHAREKEVRIIAPSSTAFVLFAAATLWDSNVDLSLSILWLFEQSPHLLCSCESFKWPVLQSVCNGRSLTMFVGCWTTTWCSAKLDSGTNWWKQCQLLRESCSLTWHMQPLTGFQWQLSMGGALGSGHAR